MESSPIVIRLPLAFPFPDLTPTAPEVPLLLELALASFFGSFRFALFPASRPAGVEHLMCRPRVHGRQQTMACICRKKMPARC